MFHMFAIRKGSQLVIDTIVNTWERRSSTRSLWQNTFSLLLALALPAPPRLLGDRVERGTPEPGRRGAGQARVAPQRLIWMFMMLGRMIMAWSQRFVEILQSRGQRRSHFIYVDSRRIVS